jgi:hypothetical protein
MSISFYPRFLKIEHILKGKTKKENRKEQRTKEIKKINKNKK